MYNIYRYLIQRYTATLLLVGLAVILGLLFLAQLPISYYPNFSVPAAIIITAYPGAGPEAVEEEITRPLEEAVATLSGIDRMESVSQEGSCRITLSFSFGVDIEAKKREVQERIDLVRGRLPREASQPSLTTINQLLPPPVQLAVTSPRRSLSELTLLARDRIAPALSRLPGVATAQVAGGNESVVAVELYPLLLRQSGVGLGQIAAAIAANNLDLSLGDIQAKDYSFTLRIGGRLNSAAEIGELPLSLAGGKIVKLKNLARVSLREKRRESYARINGRESVSILVRQPSGGNAVKVADQVRAWLKREANKLPKDIKIEVIKDESVPIRQAIYQVAVSGLLGGLLAALLIYLFLGRLANTLVIVVSIPTTLIITFAAMRIFGLSLNTVSIGGLSLSVGLVVDAAVVVLENIFRNLGETRSSGDRLNIIARATSEVGLAVSAATLTTVVVFLPLAFTSGFAKVLLGELALTVTFALFISIIIASSLVPVLSFFWAGADLAPRGLSRRFLILMDGLKSIYLQALNWLLRHRGWALALFLFMLLLGLGLLRVVDTGLLDSSDQGEFQLSLSYPRGTSLEYTDRAVRELESRILNLKGVDRTFSLVGQDPFFATPQPYAATMNIFTDGREPLATVMESVRALAERLPGAEATLRIIDATAGIQRNDVDVNIFGQDLDTLRQLGEKLKRTLVSQPEFKDIESNLSQGLPSYVLLPDRKALASLGLDVRSLSQAVRSAKSGTQVSKIRLGESEVEVEISLAGAEHMSRREMQNIPVATPRGLLPLKALGTFVEGWSPAQIVRLDQSRTVNVTGYFSGVANARRSRARLERIVSEFKLPGGYRAELRGANRAIVESFRTLGLALLVALLLEYIVLGVQFNSLSLPLVILATVPFSLPGYVGALVITGDQLNLSSFLAGIMVSGLVVNNSILLLDFVIGQRRRGSARQEAIMEAAGIRFRPVMMTSLTTILAALFLALNLGGGGRALQSLARAYIGGLSYGLLVSLLLVPVAYTLMDDLLCRFNKTCMPAEV